MSKHDLSFAETKRAIEKAPMTWLPALFIAIVKRCLEENVFNKGAMQRYITEETKKRS